MLSGWGRAERYDRWWWLAAAAEQVLGQVPGVVGGEGRQGAGGQRDGAVGVAAGAAAIDERQPPVEPVQGAAVAAGQVGHVRGDRGQPEHARAALPGAGAGLVAQDARGFGEQAPTGGQHDDRSDPAGAAGGGELPGAVPGASQGGQVDPAAGQPAEQRPPGRWCTGAAEHGADDGAMGDLDNPGSGDGAAEGDQGGARLGGRADGGVPGWTEPGD